MNPYSVALFYSFLVVLISTSECAEEVKVSSALQFHFHLQQLVVLLVLYNTYKLILCGLLQYFFVTCLYLDWFALLNNKKHVLNLLVIISIIMLILLSLNNEPSSCVLSSSECHQLDLVFNFTFMSLKVKNITCFRFQRVV